MNKINIKQRFKTKKNRILRRDGIIPGVIYGPDVDSRLVMTSDKELKRASLAPGEIHTVESDHGDLLVKFEEIQRDPVTKEPLHFSLVQLPEGIKNDVEVPVNLKGTPVGVRKGGVLVVLKYQITVNGKPRLIPDEVKGNIASMDIGDKLTVNDLNIPDRIDSLDDDHEVIAVCKPSIEAKEKFLAHEPLISQTA